MASPSHPIAPTANNLASWVNAGCTPILCNVLIQCLIKPISKDTALAEKAELAHCWPWGRSVATSIRPLVKVPCGHVFCKQCILGHWRTCARVNPVTGASEPEMEDDADIWPWACRCPVCEKCWRPAAGVWSKRDYNIEPQMGIKMVEYMTVPKSYLKDRRKGTKKNVLDEETWEVVGLEVGFSLWPLRSMDSLIASKNDQGQPVAQWIQDMAAALNARESQDAKPEEAVMVLVQAGKPGAQTSLTSGGTLSRAQVNELERAAQKLVAQNIRDLGEELHLSFRSGPQLTCYRWRGLTDPDRWAEDLQNAWIYAGGGVDPQSREWIMYE